jgi:hypothetical protein
MADHHLTSAVEQFTQAVWALGDKDLETPWAWRDYDEGLRVAFFRTYEQLRELAASLETARARSGPPVTTAQRALMAYHNAYRDLGAVLIGVDEQLASRPPAPEEWPVTRAYSHLVRADRTFFTLVHYAVRRARGADDLPAEISDEAWEAYWVNDGFTSLKEDPTLEGLVGYYAAHHQRVLGELQDIQEHELQAPSTFWESAPMSVRFRLHRFDSHLRQHTIQIEKSLVALGWPQTEALRLLRLIHNALSQVEGSLIGAPDLETSARGELADELASRAREMGGSQGAA